MGLTTGFNPADKSGNTVIAQQARRSAPLTAGPAPVYQGVPAGGFGVATPEDAKRAAQLEAVRAGGQVTISGPWVSVLRQLGKRLAPKVLQLFAKNPQAAQTVARVGVGAGAAVGTTMTTVGTGAAVCTVAATEACDPGAILAATEHACNDLQNILEKKNSTHVRLGLQPVANQEANRVSLNNFIKDKAGINWDYLKLPVVDFVVEEVSLDEYTIFALVFDKSTSKFEITAVKINKKYAPGSVVWSDNLPPSHGFAEFGTNQTLELIRSSNQVGSLFLIRPVQVGSSTNGQLNREIAYWSGNANGGLGWTLCTTPVSATSAK